MTGGAQETMSSIKRYATCRGLYRKNMAEWHPDFVNLVEARGVRMWWDTAYTVKEEVIKLYEEFGLERVLVDDVVQIHEADPDFLYDVEQYVQFFIISRINGDKIAEDLRQRVKDPGYPFTSRFTQAFLESALSFSDFILDV
jgi:hypothetical protein